MAQSQEQWQRQMWPQRGLAEERVELAELLEKSLKSNTIEWAMNLRVCELVALHASLARQAQLRISERLRSSSPVKVVLALGLLEMLVKNCGIVACQNISEDDAQTLVDLVKRRESWQYSLGRNFHKSVGSWLPTVGISEEDRQLWRQAAQKILDMLQLWTDAFMMQEERVKPIFKAYKQLRQEGYKFKSRESGNSCMDVVLIHGAEESPVLLAGAASGATGSAEVDALRASATNDAGHPVPAETEPADAEATPGPESSALQNQQNEPPVNGAAQRLRSPSEEAMKRLEDMRTWLQELQSLSSDRQVNAQLVDTSDPASEPQAAEAAEEERASAATTGDDEADGRKQELRSWLREAQHWCIGFIQQQIQHDDHPDLSDAQFEDLCVTLDEVADEMGYEDSAGQDMLGAIGDSSSLPLPPPPPTDEAAPSKEQQELNDLMLARMLQERFERELILDQEAADAALALRLSLEEEGAVMPQPQPQPMPRRRLTVGCFKCRASNELADGRPGAMFACYHCGQVQTVPRTLAGHQFQQPQIARAKPKSTAAPSTQPRRHAPPPRVLTDQSELFIHTGREEDGANNDGEEDDPRPRGQPTVLTKPDAHPESAEDEDEGPLSSSTFQAAKESLLGAPVDHASQGLSLEKLVRSWAPSSGSKSIGGGVPRKFAGVQDDDADVPFTSGGASASASGLRHNHGSRPWRKAWKKKKDQDSDIQSSLVERVQVDDEWELVRPDGGNAYWYNTSTQRSQWQAPSMVRWAGSLTSSSGSGGGSASGGRPKSGTSGYAPLGDG